MIKQSLQLCIGLALALHLLVASAALAAEATPVTVGGPVVAASLDAQGHEAWLRFEAAAAGLYRISVIDNTVDQKLVVDVYQGEGAARQGKAQYLHSKPKGEFLFGVALQPGVHYLRFWTLNAGGGFKVGVSQAEAGLAAPAITSFSVNNGATTANKQAVTLNSVCSGAPVSFLAFEKAWLTAADWAVIMKTRWADYSAAAPYALSPANGEKTVYLTVKTAEGVLSSPGTDSISLLRILPLTVNGQYRTGGLDAPGPEEEYWYQFKAPVESNYAVCAKSNAIAVGLYGPNDRSLLIAEQTVSEQALLARRLKAGVYYLKVRSAMPADSDGGSGDAPFFLKVLQTSGPILKKFGVKNVLRDALAPERSLVIASEALGEPKECMLSLSSNFRRARWQTYKAEVTFNVNSPQTAGVLYMKVRDGRGRVSPTVQMPFQIEAAKSISVDKGVTVDWPAGKSFGIFTFKVSKPGDYLVDLKMEGARGPNWVASMKLYGPNRPSRVVTSQAYHSAPLTDWDSYPKTMTGRMGARLTPGTYYLELVQNAFAKVELEVSRFSGAPILTDFHINSGANFEYTGLREVALYNRALGEPKEILVSVSPTFTGARWRAYAKSVRLTLPAGNGEVTVYAKVRNKAGVSAVYTDTIYLNEPLSLTVDDPSRMASVGYMIPDFYTFSVTAAGKYSVETQGSEFEDGVTAQFKVYDAGMKPLTPTVTKTPQLNGLRQTFALAPGSYLIEAAGLEQLPSGDDAKSYSYSIKVVSGE